MMDLSAAETRPEAPSLSGAFPRSWLLHGGRPGVADTASKSERISLYLGAELIERMKRAAAEIGADRGQPVGVSEWAREAIEKQLTSHDEKRRK